MQKPVRTTCDSRPEQFRRSENDATADLLRAVSGRDARSRQPIVERTRRAVRVADASRRENGKRSRRTTGLALFACGVLFLMLAPALWISIDDMVGGEHFSDLPTQVAIFSGVLMMAMVAALAAGWWTRLGRDDLHQDQRNLLH